jgi:2-phosphosulfolactate phosphatase
MDLSGHHNGSVTWFAQDPYGVRCEWGPVGASSLAAGCTAVVVVDVLSFTTSTCVAVERGMRVYPHAWHDSAAEYARSVGAVAAVGRRQVDPDHPWSLSPSALVRAPHTPRLVLPSPNGSTIAAATSGLVLAASLRNASAVGRWLASNGYGDPARPVLVVPAGERWPDGSLRPSLEDGLGAGAVVAALGCASMSAEASWLAAAYLGTADVAAAVRDCASGRELIRTGFGEDVAIATDLDASPVVPLLADGAFTAAP